MIYVSPVGSLKIECDAEAVVSLAPCRDNTGTPPACAAEQLAEAWLNAYFAGDRLPVLPPLRPAGSMYQKKVWKNLLSIAPGCVVSYGQLAARLQSSARAVGQAVGANPIAILIPCHRVVAAGGKIGGYAYGVEMKQALLNHEAIYGALAARQAVVDIQ